MTVVVIGGGSSLTHEQAEIVSHETCIAVNDAYLLAPFAQVSYFADSKWFEWHRDGVDKPALGLTKKQVKERFASFKGQKCSIQNSMGRITDDSVHILRNADYPGHGYGISLDSRKISTGRNSGYQAVNIAILAGAKTILLLGMDGGRINGKSHFSGGHPKQTPERAYELHRKSWDEGKSAIEATGVRVINCSLGSLIDTFPRMKLEEALEDSRRVRAW